MSLLSLSTGDLGSSARSTPQSRRDPKKQRAFLRSILEQAIEIAADVDDLFLEGDRSSDNANQEDSRSHNQSQ
jgi:hypothetical protein